MAHPLFNRGYIALLFTQFFGAANDNVLKQVLTFMVATGIWSGAFGRHGLGEGGQVVPALCLTLPFILFSGYAGQVADRFSKRRVMIGVKLAELPIALLAGVGFLLRDLWLTLFAMVLLAVQSSFFGPAKYGVIPELVEDNELSHANGILNMFTNIAIITGSLAAGPVSDWFHPKPDADGVLPHNPVLWAPGALLLIVALLGLAAIIVMPRLQPGDRNLKWDLNPVGTYWQSLREMARGPLLAVAVAWSYFYLIGMIALLILPEYEAILAIDYTTNSYLLGILGISIGVGSLLAGLVSGHRIRPGLIPIGAIGMTIFFGLLGAVTPRYWNVATFIFGAGVCAGFYIIPLQALVQFLAPDDERGRFIGTANALSFCFSSLGALIFWLMVNRLAVAPNRVFLLCAALALIGSAVGLVRLKRQLEPALRDPNAAT